MPVSSTNGSHVGGTGGLNAIGVLDAPCTLLADGPPTVWGEIWLMNVSDKNFQDGPSAVNCLVFRELLNWVSKIIRECIGFALICSMIGLKNSATPSLAIRCITYTYHDSVTRAFPRFWRVAYFYFEFHWLFRVFSFLLIGFSYYWVVFGFNDTQSKSALLRISISRSFFRDVAFFSDLIKLKVAVP